MLDWLKRKSAPGPNEQLLESEGQKPITDERVERLLGRLGPDSRTQREPATEARNRADLPPNAKLVAEPLNEIAPTPTADSMPASEPVTETPPPSTDGGADARFTLRREDRTITRRGQGPSAAELLAKGYSFATGPDGKMVVFDTEGNVTDMALPRPSAAPGADSAPVAEVVREIDQPPSADSSAASQPAAEALQEAAPPPSTDNSEANQPAVEALQEPAPPQTDRKRGKKPAVEALQEPALLPQTDRKRPRKPAPEPLTEIEAPPKFDSKTPKERGGGIAGMYVIAIASQKGGSGKTTIAAHLAVRAGLADNGPIVLIDTDPQGSLAEWWHARAADTPQLATVKPEALAANLAELRSYGTAIAIIDTPPALTGSIEQVIALADFILIPVRPSPHDLRAAGGTVELARKAGKPFMFIVNSASPRASLTAQAVAALSEHGRVAPVILYQRTEYAASMIDGRTVSETAASGRSAQEIAGLWESVYAQIGLRVAA